MNHIHSIHALSKDARSARDSPPGEPYKLYMSSLHLNEQKMQSSRSAKYLREKLEKTRTSIVNDADRSGSNCAQHFRFHDRPRYIRHNDVFIEEGIFARFYPSPSETR